MKQLLNLLLNWCIIPKYAKNVHIYALKCREKAYYSYKQKLTISYDFLTLISIFLVSQGWQPCKGIDIIAVMLVMKYSYYSAVITVLCTNALCLLVHIISGCVV